MLLIGRTAAGRVFWVERAGLALDARVDPPEVMPAEAFRVWLELIGRPVAIDRHGIQALAGRRRIGRWRGPVLMVLLR